jgi:sialate O-acetylesterase
MRRFALAFLGAIAVAHADVRLPPVFSDHMVLQAGRNVPVWGSADPGERITVSIAGHQHAPVRPGLQPVAADPQRQRTAVLRTRIVQQGHGVAVETVQRRLRAGIRDVGPAGIRM